MSLFNRDSVSLEKLNRARQAMLEREAELMSIRSKIFQMKEAILNQEKTVASLEEIVSQHVDSAEHEVAMQQAYSQEIEACKQKIEQLHQMLAASQAKQDEHRQQTDEAQQQIKLENEEKDTINSTITAQTNMFKEQHKDHGALSTAFEKASNTDRKKRHNGPTPGHIEIKTNLSVVTKLHALGDVHGWAPGFINYLQHNGMAAISVGGKNLDKDHAAFIFGNPMEAIANQRDLPRVGLDGHPNRNKNIHTPFHRIMVKEHLNGEALICAGDLVDRGDHNELVLELVRQSVLQNMGMRWTLIGNHEQMLLESDYRRWEKNEHNYMAEANKEHAGSFVHQPALTGCETVHDGLSMNFEILRASLGALLLAQHLALMKSLDDKARAVYKNQTSDVFQKLGLGEDKLTKILAESKWEMYKFGHALMEVVQQCSEEQECIIPGAIGVAMYADHLFVHAEPNGLKELHEGMKDDIRFMKTQNGFTFSLARMFRSKVVNPDYLWARSWKEEGGRISEIIKAIATESVTHVVHGHQAGPGIRFDQTSDDKPITVVAIDEGMTPYYHYNYGHFENAYDASRVPDGYSVVIK